MLTPVTSSSRVGAQPSVWDVPIALWVYAVLRSLAFVAPSWTENGRVGLGVVVVLVLFVFVLRRSSAAYKALIVLDIFSHVMLFATWLDANDAPFSIPVLAGLSLVALLWPSNWHYVSSRGAVATSSDQGTTGK